MPNETTIAEPPPETETKPSAPPAKPPPEKPAPPKAPSSDAAPVTAEEIVDADKDEFPGEEEGQGPADADPEEKAPDPSPAPLTEEEKSKAGRKPAPPTGDPEIDAKREAERAKDRARKKSKNFRPAPDFSRERARAGSAAPPPPRGEEETARPAPQASAAVDYKALAESCFAIVTGVACNVIGPEWRPKSEEEKNSVVVPLEIYLRAKNVPDLPPGVILALACASYAGSRLREPNTITRVKGFWGWVKSKLWRKRRPMHVVSEQARAAA